MPACSIRGEGDWMSTESTERVEVDVEEVKRTDEAILVEDSEGQKHWLPLSQVVILEEEFTPGPMKLSIPEWLAIEKGLV